MTNETIKPNEAPTTPKEDTGGDCVDRPVGLSSTIEHISNRVMIYADQRYPNRMNQYAIEDIVFDEINKESGCLRESVSRAIDILDGNADLIDWRDGSQPELLRKLCEHLEAFAMKRGFISRPNAKDDRREAFGPSPC